jgi:drug/metabolite transporter (DMT)-like permease
VSVVLALVAALTYGVSDFVGGLATRRERALSVLLVSYPVGTACMLALLPAFGGQPDVASLGWATAAGLAGAGGVALLYVGLATGPMGVVAPLTAVASAVVPVMVGIGLGERPPPLAYLGAVLAVAAVALVSRAPGGGHGDDRSHARVTVRAIELALLAGVGFGLYFVLLARTAPESGLWPLVASRLAAAVAIGAAALVVSSRPRPARGSVLRLALVAGTLDALANLAYLLAVRQGLLALVAVLVALYPAATVGLATVVLGERTGRAQRLGLLVAAGSVALIAWAS